MRLGIQRLNPMHHEDLNGPDRRISEIHCEWGKGQLFSKCLLGIFNSPKKRMKNFNFTTMVPQVELFSFVFYGELKTPKRHFEIN